MSEQQSKELSVLASSTKDTSAGQQGDNCSEALSVGKSA